MASSRQLKLLAADRASTKEVYFHVLTFIYLDANWLV